MAQPAAAKLQIVQTIPNYHREFDSSCVYWIEANKVDALFFHSNLSDFTNDNTTFDKSNKEFVSYEINFNTQFNKLEEHLTGIDYHFAKQKMKELLSELQNYNPDALSVELSHDRLIFYTLIKDSYTIFLTQYLDREIDDDEVSLSIFDKQQKLPSYFGTLEGAINVLNSRIDSKNKILLKFC